MSHKVTTSWKGKMSFESDIQGHKIRIDAEEKVGGENKGPIPKPLVLTALTGCTGMDVVSLLNKMQVVFDDFRLEAEGQMSENHPKVYTTIHLKYIFKSHDPNKAKIEKAVKLSQERYCGVNDMLKKVSDVTYEIVYE